MSMRSVFLAVGAGAVALVFAALVLGPAWAQQTPPATPGAGGPARPGVQAFHAALASQLGVSVERLQQAMAAARAQVSAANSGATPGHGPGPNGPRPAFGVRRDLSVAAQAIGITPEQLRQELPGKSLAAVAQAHGKNPADVAAALKAAANQRIDEQMNRVVPTMGVRGIPWGNGAPGAFQAPDRLPGFPPTQSPGGVPGSSPTQSPVPSGVPFPSPARTATPSPSPTQGG